MALEINSTTPVLVSGGASGLGAAVAAHFVSLGAPIGILDVSGPKSGVDMTGPSQFSTYCDVADANSVSLAVERLRAEIGQERVCVCCAGVAPSARTVGREGVHSPELFAKVISINLMGTFHVASYAAQGMSKADPMGDDAERGVIVTTASIAACEGQIGQVAYAASKAGVAGMTLPMARDLASRGVRVLSIAPGIFGTPMVTSFPQGVQDALASNIPFPSRLGRPDEFASMVEHLVSNTMMNGETVRIDGATRLQAR